MFLRFLAFGKMWNLFWHNLGKTLCLENIFWDIKVVANLPRIKNLCQSFAPPETSPLSREAVPLNVLNCFM